VGLWFLFVAQEIRASVRYARSIRRYKSVVENTYEYENVKEAIKSIKENVVGPAEAKVKELRQRN
jgi:hypothetical protein